VVTSPIAAQLKVGFTISKDTIEIGDILTITLSVPTHIATTDCKIDLNSYSSIPNLIYAQDTTILEPIADFNLLTADDLDLNTLLPLSKFEKTTANDLDTYTLDVSIYNTGVYALSAPTVICGKDTISGGSQTLFVKMPQILMAKDSLSLNPIKDIIIEPKNWEDYQLYLYIILGLILLYLAFRYYKNRPVKEVKQEIPIVVIPPHTRAIKALKDLKFKELWEKGQTKEYQSELTTIIRTYIEDRYEVSANEMTTSEIKEAIRALLHDVQLQNDLMQILSIADLIKFAKARPDETIHATFMNMAVNFVDKTKEENE